MGHQKGMNEQGVRSSRNEPWQRPLQNNHLRNLSPCKKRFGAITNVWL